MAKIKDFSAGVYNLLDSALDHEPNSELAASYAMSIGGELAKSTLKRDRIRVQGKMWASDLGESCFRKTWYKWNKPAESEKLQGFTKFKFLYGNILEEAVLYLGDEAGHSIEFQQEPVKVDLSAEWRISGRIDAVVDGVLIDVKSTSTFGFQKYKKDGLTHDNDAFGYLWQLGYYYHFGEFKYIQDECGFIWIDKQNGHIMYNDVADEIPSKDDILTRAKNIASTASSDDEPAIMLDADVDDGKSGNKKLGIKCSYCDFKKHCHRNANGGKGLRIFSSYKGPVFLTEVKREPRMAEIT